MKDCVGSDVPVLSSKKENFELVSLQYILVIIKLVKFLLSIYIGALFKTVTRNFTKIVYEEYYFMFSCY